MKSQRQPRRLRVTVSDRAHLQYLIFVCSVWPYIRKGGQTAAKRPSCGPFLAVWTPLWHGVRLHQRWSSGGNRTLMPPAVLDPTLIGAIDSVGTNRCDGVNMAGLLELGLLNCATCTSRHGWMRMSLITPSHTRRTSCCGSFG